MSYSLSILQCDDLNAWFKRDENTDYSEEDAEMRIPRLALLISMLVICLCAWTGSSWGKTPMETIQEGTDKVISILKDPALKGPEHKEERRQKIWDVISHYFDFREMAKRSLGRHWRKLNPQQRDEFVDLYSFLLQHSYIGKIDKYTNEKVVYQKEVIDGKYALVNTIILSKNDVQIPVDYRLKKKDNKWMVYDVSVEGVSLVNNYRAQFNSVIVSKGYDALVEKLKKKKSEAKSEKKSETSEGEKTGGQ